MNFNVVKHDWMKRRVEDLAETNETQPPKYTESN